MPKRTKNLIHELIRSVEEDIEAMEVQLAAVASDKIVASTPTRIDQSP